MTLAELNTLDPLHAMQFRAPPQPQVSGVRPVQPRSPSDRDCPLDTLVTAACGTRVARPGSTTMLRT